MRYILFWISILGFAIQQLIVSNYDKTKKEVNYKIQPNIFWYILLIIWRYPRRLLKKLADYVFKIL